MFKLIKLAIKLFVLVLIVVGGMYIYYNYFSVDSAMSETQIETLELMGPPEQFAITYLPQGDGENEHLARQEVWFYPSKAQKFSFLAGVLTGTEDLEIIEGANYSKTTLKSEEFDFYTSYDDLKMKFGESNIAPIDLPPFTDEEGDVKTVATEDAIFIFEQGYLTYMETLD